MAFSRLPTKVPPAITLWPVFVKDAWQVASCKILVTAAVCCGEGQGWMSRRLVDRVPRGICRSHPQANVLARGGRFWEKGEEVCLRLLEYNFGKEEWEKRRGKKSISRIDAPPQFSNQHHLRQLPNKATKPFRHLIFRHVATPSSTLPRCSQAPLLSRCCVLLTTHGTDNMLSSSVLVRTMSNVEVDCPFCRDR